MRRSAEAEKQIDEKNGQIEALHKRELTKETGLALGAINKMIKRLNYRRICAKCVPKLLTTEVKTARKEAAQQLLAHYYREGE